MTDTKHYIMNCPACGKQMKKIFIEDENVNIDICTDGCGGIFFDNRELEKFDEQNENADAIFNALGDKEYEPVNEQEVRVCPVCDTPMIKLGGKDSVQIDVCNVCGGKFLDNGELERIREEKNQNPVLKESLYKILEQSAIDETLGSVGSFVHKKMTRTPFREAFESIVRKMQ